MTGAPYEVARDLLGCLVTDGVLTVRLVEVEAYTGGDRPGVAFVSGPNAPQRADVGTTRKAVRLLHVRNALVHECRVRSR